jgi:hypothetical protein
MALAPAANNQLDPALANGCEREGEVVILSFAMVERKAFEPLRGAI